MLKLLKRCFSKKKPFLPRWNIAIDKTWIRFYHKPISEQALRKFERDSERLCKLAAKYVSKGKL